MILDLCQRAELLDSRERLLQYSIRPQRHPWTTPQPDSIGADRAAALIKGLRGRELARERFDDFRRLSAWALRQADPTGQAALVCYGSAGGRHFVRGSDADYVVFCDGDWKAVAERLESALRPVAHGLRLINFRSPEDTVRHVTELRAHSFLGGNRSRYYRSALSHGLPSVLNDGLLVLSLARSDLYAAWRAERKDRDIKYGFGGLRDIEAIYRAASLYADDIAHKFSATAPLDALNRKGVLAREEILKIGDAADFFLCAKDCVAGTTIDTPEKSRVLSAALGMTPDEIERRHLTHARHISAIVDKLRTRVLGDFAGTLAVMIRTLKDEAKLSVLIDHVLDPARSSPEVRREVLITLSLRYDLSPTMLFAVEAMLERNKDRLELQEMQKEFFPWALGRSMAA